MRSICGRGAEDFFCENIGGTSVSSPIMTLIISVTIAATLKSGDAVKLRYHMKMRLNNSSLISVNSDRNHLRLTQMIN